ncbi:MAG: hypothetical protein LC624_04745, partial [Halobacteriales archaeon]|nr:hypothetical protein [Halobacteriales archaeon]
VLLAPLFLGFAACLREVLGATPRGRFLAGLAFAAVLIEVALLLVQTSLAAAMTALAPTAQPILPLFRSWDLLYNGAADGVEMVWLGLFGLAAVKVAGFPRWFPAFTLAAAALHVPLVFGVLLGLGNAPHLLLYLPSIAWWPIVIVSLARHARADSAIPTRRATRIVPMQAGKP